MNSLPLVSIIMPIYGVERYLNRAIDSVLDQTFSYWELIIVNDGSLDKSREIAYSYVLRDCRIKLYDKPNGGLSDARNFGLQFARGKYIHFFDSDDWIEPFTYESLISKIQDETIDILIFGYYIDSEDNNGKLVSQIRKQSIDLIYPFIDRNLFVEKLEDFLNFAWNKLYRTDFIKSNSLSFQKGLSVIEDIEFQSRVFPLVKKIQFVSDVTYHYMNRNRQTLSKKYNSDLLFLYEKRLHLYRDMMLCLGVDENIINRRLNELSFIDFSYCVLLIFFSYPDLFDKQRNKELRKVLDNSFYKHQIKYYHAKGIKDFIKKKLFETHFVFGITILFFIISRKITI